MEYAVIGALIVSGIILLGVGIYVMLEGRRGRNVWFCIFRSNSSTDSGANRPPIPIESIH